MSLEEKLQQVRDPAFAFTLALSPYATLSIERDHPRCTHMSYKAERTDRLPLSVQTPWLNPPEREFADFAAKQRDIAKRRADVVIAGEGQFLAAFRRDVHYLAVNAIKFHNQALFSQTLPWLYGGLHKIKDLCTLGSYTRRLTSAYEQAREAALGWELVVQATTRLSEHHAHYVRPEDHCIRAASAVYNRLAIKARNAAKFSQLIVNSLAQFVPEGRPVPTTALHELLAPTPIRKEDGTPDYDLLSTL